MVNYVTRIKVAAIAEEMTLVVCLFIILCF